MFTGTGVLGQPPPPSPEIVLVNIARNAISPPPDNNTDGTASISVSSSHSRVFPGTITSNRCSRSTNFSDSFLDMMRLQMMHDVQQRSYDKDKLAEIQAEKMRVREDRLEKAERRREEEERARTERREEEEREREREREERREENEMERRHMQQMFMMAIGGGINVLGGNKKRKKRKRGNKGNQRGSSAEESVSSEESSSTSNSDKDSKINYSQVYDLYQDQKQF